MSYNGVFWGCNRHARKMVWRFVALKVPRSDWNRPGLGRTGLEFDMATIAERIERMTTVNPDTDCWEWSAQRNPYGYGQIKIGGRSGRLRLAHRVAYETYVGEIPAGLDLDHLCRVRACVNPCHLEPVTRSENMLRSPWCPKDECRNGHRRTAENCYFAPGGQRYCIPCQREWKARRRAEKEGRSWPRSFRP